MFEFLGIMTLALRLGANRGGMPALVIGGAFVTIGLGLQIRAIAQPTRSRIEGEQAFRAGRALSGGRARDCYARRLRGVEAEGAARQFGLLIHPQRRGLVPAR